MHLYVAVVGLVCASSSAACSCAFQPTEQVGGSTPSSCAFQPTEQVSGSTPREQSMLSASTSAASSSAFQPTEQVSASPVDLTDAWADIHKPTAMAPKAKSKNYSTKQQRITLVNSSSSSSSISISSSSRSTSSAVITCVFIPIIQTEWQRSIWHPPLVWPPPGFDDDGEDMGMCGC
jgi:hypothetical protein